MPEVEIRAARPDEATAVQVVVRAAFGDEGDVVGRLVTALGSAGHVRTSLVAVDDGRVVGHVQLNRSWVDARDRLVEVVVLSPLSVAPDAQRTGVGTALLQAAVRAADELGSPALFLEGSPTWYSARGFRPAAPLGFARPSDRIPEPAFQVILLGHDRGHRGRFVYCDPFWSLDCVGLRDPLLAELEGGVR